MSVNLIRTTKMGVSIFGANLLVVYTFKEQLEHSVFGFPHFATCTSLAFCRTCLVFTAGSIWYQLHTGPSYHSPSIMFTTALYSRTTKHAPNKQYFFCEYYMWRGWKTNMHVSCFPFATVNLLLFIKQIYIQFVINQKWEPPSKMTLR